MDALDKSLKITEDEPIEAPTKYYIYRYDSKGERLYLGGKGADHCGLWAFAPEELRAAFDTKEEAKKKALELDFGFKFAGPVHIVEKAQCTKKEELFPLLDETRMMKCGQAATIIRHGSDSDIDIQFEDGSIATNITYENFQKGDITSPMLHRENTFSQQQKQTQERVRGISEQALQPTTKRKGR